MKRLILVCGPNGVGKTTACQRLLEALPRSAYIDSDWCRMMNPFAFDAATTEIIIANIAALMRNYFRSPVTENVIFSYGFHGPRQRIFQGVRHDLDMSGVAYQFCPILLECSLQEQRRRLMASGRDSARIERAIRNTRHVYSACAYPAVDTTDLSVSQTVERILSVLAECYDDQRSAVPLGSERKAETDRP